MRLRFVRVMVFTKGRAHSGDYVAHCARRIFINPHIQLPHQIYLCAAWTPAFFFTQAMCPYRTLQLVQCRTSNCPNPSLRRSQVHMMRKNCSWLAVKWLCIGEQMIQGVCFGREVMIQLRGSEDLFCAAANQ